MTLSPPLDWLKRIDKALLKLDEKPQFAFPAPFPLKRVEALLRQLFNHEAVSLKLQERGWLEADQILSGLGEHLYPLKIEMTPLEEPLYFVLSEQDLAELMSGLLGGEIESAPFYDPALTNGFYHYLALEALQLIEEAKFAHPLSPRLGEIPKDIGEAIGQSPCFVVDLSIELDRKTVWGRVIVPASFRKAFKAHFVSFPPQALSRSAQQKIPVTISMLVGYSELRLEDYRNISAGDFVILDRCSYDPLEKKGTVIMVLGETPLFRGKIKSGEIKILEYPRYEEVKMEEEDMESEEEGLEKEESKPIRVEDLLINLTVEVGRVRMSVSELANLTPGNLIELNIAPEQGVNLIVSGKKNWERRTCSDRRDLRCPHHYHLNLRCPLR